MNRRKTNKYRYAYAHIHITHIIYYSSQTMIFDIIFESI